MKMKAHILRLKQCYMLLMPTLWVIICYFSVYFFNMKIAIKALEYNHKLTQPDSNIY